MLEEDIQKLIKLGWWLSVVPVITGSSWQFKCDIYKRLPKSGNWITATRKTFNTPQSCYSWALTYLENKQYVSTITK